MTHKSTEGFGLEDFRSVSEPAETLDDAALADSEPEHDDEHDSHKAKIAMGVGALGLMGIATAIAYRNLRKQHKEGN